MGVMNYEQADAALIAVLDGMLEAARRCFDHYKVQEIQGVWLPRPSPDINELVIPIIAAMETHPEFKKAESRFFGSKQLMIQPHSQSRNLLKVAVERSPSAAIAWYRKVISTRQADLRYVAEVYGLDISQPVKLSNGVCLVALSDLPPSANARTIQSQFEITPRRLRLHALSIPIGALLEMQCVSSSTSWQIQTMPPRSEELERTVRAFTLVDKASPIIGTSWLDFVDDDLHMAEVGMMSMSPSYEGLPPVFAINVDAEATKWVEQYLCLSPSLRPQCDVAIERLNLARRRHSPGNKAIEAGICLEALLGADSNQEITYRLRLRAALLLASDLDKRREISKAVADLYNLRSAAVHGALFKAKDIPTNVARVERGLEICAQVLREIVSSNKDFVAADWELSGGKPQ
jgi:hypothetical protein